MILLFNYWRLEFDSYQSCPQHVYSCRINYMRFCNHHLQVLLSWQLLSQLLILCDHRASTISSKICHRHKSNNDRFRLVHHESRLHVNSMGFTILWCKAFPKSAQYVWFYSQEYSLDFWLCPWIFSKRV